MKSTINVIFLLSLFTFFVAGCINGRNETYNIIEKNKELTNKIFRVIEADNFDGLDSLIALDFVDHIEDSLVTGRGREGFKKSCIKLKKGFPNAKFIIHSILGEENRISVHFTMEGLNSGMYVMGMAPSNLILKRPEMNILEFKDGMLVERWGVAEDISVLIQIGMMEIPKNGIPDDTLKKYIPNHP